MSVDSKDWGQPHFATGLFTTAASAVDVTETVGFAPSFVVVFVNTSATNPDILFATSADTAQSFLITGSTGVVTLIAVATGIDISGNTVIIRSERQTNSGTNFWIAFR